MIRRNGLIHRAVKELAKNLVIKNVNKTNYKKMCLLIYITKPFVLKGHDIRHTNYYEAKAIVNVFEQMGYNVDIVFLSSEKAIDYYKYDVIIGLGDAYDNSFGKCKPQCTRIYYATGAHYLVACNEELARWRDLYKRKTCSLGKLRTPMPRKPLRREFSIMNSKAIVGVGGPWAAQTYQESGLKYYDVGAIAFELPLKIERKYNMAKKNFLFLSGDGFVHKGVDLFVEVFANIPDCNLYIAGTADQTFLSIYRSELNLSNIHYVGFTEIYSNEFKELCQKCAFIVSASCSEGCSTSILTGMASGLIPIVTEREGVRIKDSGVVIPEASITEIEKAVLSLSQKSNSELLTMSNQAIEVVKNQYTYDNFRKRLFNAVSEILGENAVC